MFRDQRLGEGQSDVDGYLSSLEADRRIFLADLLVDRAHLVMLREQGHISREVCSRIMAVIDELQSAAAPEALAGGEDIHEAIEAHILSRAGPEGGRMHTGRSRNDEVATCIRLALRSEMLALQGEQISLIETLVRLAERHKESLMPGFTHTQHAQPTTLAHHLLAHADAALRDLSRLEDAYGRINRSPLGAAAFASTGFKIDRMRTCRLLGFDGLVENSMDAVSSRDFILESLSAMSILMVNASRLAEELILWSTSEFGYVELDNIYASTSSIMPQKKNPDTAELARGKSGSVLGSLVSALSICKALPLSYNRDLQEVTPHLWRAVDWTRSTVRILEGSLHSAKFNLERMQACSAAGFSTATELADSLVRITGMPFRTAHSIVGRIASEGSSVGMAELDEAALQIAGYSASSRGYTQADLARALDPRSNVAVRSNTGGPAPAETGRMIEERTALIKAARERLAERRERVDRALQELLAEK
ncbi:MAG TPA: argininosuccinate lyase [Methanothrix sp.]|nr:argininosuccinate lyase [Methanothrix sp.]HOV82081.1 argininosuccinate lyase [Methanothrix sp.]HPC90475.1 argininosuccinate lyase [Methanothrix sp.]HQE88358.1 argininosuccinate lyase [Methanothrix sp.]HQI67718.1 argininosuccinate lyase [Methanothrix sp.]